ncbi:MAG: metal-dependent hydrolase [Candidatus Pacearchaeota archaeon]|nr:MAG: metal-dependent hydrolase [Candidatus Pacearchaeota archaeon]
MKINGLELRWLGHASFLIKIEDKNKIIYVDPYNLRDNLEKADFIFITHNHYDHCSLIDLKKIVKEGTKIISPADCQSILSKIEEKVEVEIIGPDMEKDFQDFRVISVPAYNTDKTFHPKESSWVGYVIKIKEVIIYHAGDTDLIPEMQKLTGHKQQGKTFIALLPVGGRFTMSADEAAEAAKIIKPTIAIPMHWGSIIGSEEDAKEFCELCKESEIQTEILEKD